MQPPYNYPRRNPPSLSSRTPPTRPPPPTPSQPSRPRLPLYIQYGRRSRTCRYGPPAARQHVRSIAPLVLTISNVHSHSLSMGALFIGVLISTASVFISCRKRHPILNRSSTQAVGCIMPASMDILLAVPEGPIPSQVIGKLNKIAAVAHGLTTSQGRHDDVLRHGPRDPHLPLGLLVLDQQLWEPRHPRHGSVEHCR